MKSRKGMKYIKSFPKAEPIVSMIDFKGRILVATTQRIFELKDNKITLIKIESKNDF